MMKWFEGDISEAITLTRQRNAIFVVFVYGNDDKSTATLNAINSPEVASKLSSNDYVAVKLESGSQPYYQFVQIYQLVPVPSLFFIGENGVPLDVVPGQVSSSQLVEHIDKVQAAGKPQPPNVASGSSTSAVAEHKVEPKSSSSTTQQAEPSSTPAATTSDDLEERIKRAEKARLALAAKKQKEEEEKEKERELARRRQGQEVAKAKKEREALEAQQAVEERRRDRELEREAREKVLQQIAQDKVERAARFAAAAAEASPPPAASTPVAPTRSIPANSSTRLQFRLPDGSSHTNVFGAHTLLREIRQYVRTNLHSKSCVLSMAFPRSELAFSDDEQTLLELGLVPSAALLILPSSSASGAVASSGGGLGALIWFILSPFTLMWSFLSARIWGSPTSPDSQQDRGQSAAAAAAQSRASQNTVRQRVRREGNIHRLAGSQDPDDENNTYNGNSTQQM